MRILVLGADGYLGWPTAAYLAAKGHEVWAVDNYLRRRLCLDLDVEPLFPVPNLDVRARIWEAQGGKKIRTIIGDCCDYNFLCSIFEEFAPEAVVHYAEQPSAPYSMLDAQAARLTVSNNLISTLNIIWALRLHAPECAIVKIGTMGEYGTPEIDIEEGWIEIHHKGRKDRFLFPRQASSLYHTTKIQDTDLLWFYVRTWGIRVTDLMQGPVYGMVTEQTAHDPGLATCFNYDEIFGTVINRFVVQAVAGYPLTVFGKGGQTRGYINIIDTLRCVELSILNPPQPGQMQIYNQVTQTFSVNELAHKVASVGQSMGLGVQIKSVPNPRKEKEEHYYNPIYAGLKELGLVPSLLTDDVLSDMISRVMEHKNKIDEHKIFRSVRW